MTYNGLGINQIQVAGRRDTRKFGNEISHVPGWVPNWIRREVAVCMIQVDITPYHFEDVSRYGQNCQRTRTNLPKESSSPSSFSPPLATPRHLRNPTGIVGNQTPKHFAMQASQRLRCIVRSLGTGPGQRKSRSQAFHPAFCTGSGKSVSQEASIGVYQMPQHWNMR